MEQAAAQILMADDEEPIRVTMSAILRRRGYEVTVVENGEAALMQLHQRSYDLLLLDLKMPGLSGIEVAKRAREVQPHAAIIILTGHGSLESALDGLHAGVFDYLLKTSSPQDVLARVAAALQEQAEERRKQRVMTALQGVVADLGGVQPPPTTGEQWLEVGDLQLASWNQTVRRGEHAFALTPTEFRILLCLAQQAGRVMSYGQIVQCALGYAVQAVEAAELIKPHLYHIRQKIEPDPSNPRYILTVRSTGYMLAAARETS